MGNILEQYRRKIKPEWKLAFWSAVIIGFLVHAYRFTHALANHDSLYNYYSSQNMIGSGRWLLGLACSLSSGFDLPWVIGIISLFFIGLTAVVIVDIFQARDHVLIVLICGLLASFPALTDTFSYCFTADGYMIAMFLAALSVRLCLMDQRRIWPMAASALCLCCVGGIYQSYLSFALVLAIGHFLTELLEGKRSNKECFAWIGREALIYAAGVAGYFGIWKLCLHFQRIPVTSYMGMDTAGQLSLQSLIASTKMALRNFLLFFLDWDITKYGLSAWGAAGIAFLVLAAVVFVIALVRSGLLRRKVQLLLGAVALCAVPFVLNVFVFASLKTTYGLRMEQGYCILYILVAVLAARWLSVKLSTLTALILAVLVFRNGVLANTFYYQMERCNRKSFATAVEISSRVHALDDGTVRYIAIGGHLDTWDPEAIQDPGQLGSLGRLRVLNRTLLLDQNYASLFLENELGFELSYYRMNGLEPPLRERLPEDPAPYDWEFRFPTVSHSRLKEIEASPQYQAMPSWPAAGSVQVQGDTIVVKLS